VLNQKSALNGQSLGWRQGMTTWQPLSEISALADIFPPIELPDFLKKKPAAANSSADQAGVYCSHTFSFYRVLFHLIAAKLLLIHNFCDVFFLC
jgi:hypothetical protein